MFSFIREDQFHLLAARHFWIRPKSLIYFGLKTATWVFFFPFWLVKNIHLYLYENWHRGYWRSLKESPKLLYIGNMIGIFQDYTWSNSVTSWISQLHHTVVGVGEVGLSSGSLSLKRKKKSVKIYWVPENYPLAFFPSLVRTSSTVRCKILLGNIFSLDPSPFL